MSRWLSVIGLTERGLDGLTAEARALIDQAELIVGGERHLALVPAGKAERQTWQSPLRLTIEEILRWRGRPVVVLASGDPMWFGVGVTLARRVAQEEMRVLPQVSALVAPSIARCRSPPMMSAAAAMVARWIGGKPSMPSSPMPITVSQALMPCRPAAH